MKKIIVCSLLFTCLLLKANAFSVVPKTAVKPNKDISITVQICIGVWVGGNTCIGYYHTETVTIKTPDVPNSKTVIPANVEAVFSKDGKTLEFLNMPKEVVSVSFNKDIVIKNDTKTASVTITKGTYVLNAARQYVPSVVFTEKINTN